MININYDMVYLQIFKNSVLLFTNVMNLSQITLILFSHK